MERILLVDDEVEALQILAWLLSDHGCEVRTATNVDQAVSLGREFGPTLVITDYFLQDDATGIDVIRSLREVDAALPAVLVTGMDASTLRRDLASIGDVTVLRKPFGWAELLPLLRTAS
jgi:DNA-binding response OmpR family regulator